MTRNQWSITLIGAVTTFLSVMIGSDREVVASEVETLIFNNIQTPTRQNDLFSVFSNNPSC
jgi:hypothetical protein